MWLCGQSATWHYEWVFLIICGYPAKVDNHRPCGRRDVKLSICHVTSRGQRVIWQHEWVPLIISHHPVKFGGHSFCGLGDIKLLIYHIIPHDHMVTSWVSSPHYKPLSCLVWWLFALQKRRYFVFNLSCDFKWPHGQGVMLHCGWGPLILNHHSSGPMSVFVENTKLTCNDLCWSVTYVSNQLMFLILWQKLFQMSKLWCFF